MRDPKFWTDILTAVWLIWIGGNMKTDNAGSALLFKVLPLILAFLLAMSQARVIF